MLNKNKIQKAFASNHHLIIKAVSSQRPEVKGLTADDIEQEVAIKLLNLIKSDPENEKVSSYSYIYRITANVIIDLARKNQKNKGEITLASDENDEGFYSPDLVSESLEPEKEKANDDLLKSALAVIETLAENRRVAVKLQLQGFSINEIADMTGWSFHKAGNLTKRGMSDLKGKLKQLGIEYEIN